MNAGKRLPRAGATARRCSSHSSWPSGKADTGAPKSFDADSHFDRYGGTLVVVAAAAAAAAAAALLTPQAMRGMVSFVVPYLERSRPTNLNNSAGIAFCHIITGDAALQVALEPPPRQNIIKKKKKKWRFFFFFLPPRPSRQRSIQYFYAMPPACPTNLYYQGGEHWGRSLCLYTAQSLTYCRKRRALVPGGVDEKTDQMGRLATLCGTDPTN